MSVVIIKNKHGWIAYIRGTQHDQDIFNANKNRLYDKIEEALNG